MKKDCSSTDAGEFGDEERARFIEDLQGILQAFERGLAGKQQPGVTSHWDVVLRSLGLDPKLMPREHVEHVVTACCYLGSMWQGRRAFDCLVDAVEGEVGDGVRGELLSQLQETPIQVFRTTRKPSGKLWRVRPCFGPVAGREMLVHGVVALEGAAPGEEESEECFGYVGIPLTWNGWRLLLVINRIGILKSGLSWIAEGFEGLDADDFAARFEPEVIGCAMNPEGRFDILVAPYVGPRPCRVSTVHATVPDEIRKEYRTYFSRRLLNHVRWMAVGSGSVTGWIAALHTDEDFARLESRVAEYYGWAYQTNLRLAGKKEAAVLAETTLDWAHRVLMSNVDANKAFRDDLMREPVALLLVDEGYLNELEVDRLTSIREALRQAELMGKNSMAIRLGNAFRQFHKEQRWCRLHGIGEDGLFVGSALTGAVIRHTLVIVDGRYKELSIEDLGLKRSIAALLNEGVQAAGYMPRLERMSDLYPGELFFLSMKGIGKGAVGHVQEQMVELAFVWRYRAAGLGARRLRRGKAVSDEEVRGLVEGLEELGALFGGQS